MKFRVTVLETCLQTHCRLFFLFLRIFSFISWQAYYWQGYDLDRSLWMHFLLLLLWLYLSLVFHLGFLDSIDTEHWRFLFRQISVSFFYFLTGFLLVKVMVQIHAHGCTACCCYGIVLVKLLHFMVLDSINTVDFCLGRCLFLSFIS